jgi:hypothetical protein
MIEYSVPASGGTTLTYPILQNTVDLSTADFTKLNSSPLIILPNLGNYICPLNITLQYNCTNSGAIPLGIFFIGFESLLINNSLSAFLVYDIFSVPIPNGILTFGGRLDYPPTYSTNTDTNQPLVVWSNIDDTNFTFSKFIVTITYLRIPQL